MRYYIHSELLRKKKTGSRNGVETGYFIEFQGPKKPKKTSPALSKPEHNKEITWFLYIANGDPYLQGPKLGHPESNFMVIVFLGRASS